MGTIFNSIAMHGYDILEEESFKANINRLQGAIDDVVANLIQFLRTGRIGMTPMPIYMPLRTSILIPILAVVL